MICFVEDSSAFRRFCVKRWRMNHFETIFIATLYFYFIETSEFCDVLFYFKQKRYLQQRLKFKSLKRCDVQRSYTHTFTILYPQTLANRYFRNNILSNIQNCLTSKHRATQLSCRFVLSHLSTTTHQKLCDIYSCNIGYWNLLKHYSTKCLKKSHKSNVIDSVNRNAVWCIVLF